MSEPQITKTRAKKLGLKLVRLLTLDEGVLKRLPPEKRNTSVIYGLDGPQDQQLVHRKGKRPPKLLLHKRTGLPIRPLCVHNGKIVRAVPIDWDWGIELVALRAVDPALS